MLQASFKYDYDYLFDYIQVMFDETIVLFDVSETQIWVLMDVIL